MTTATEEAIVDFLGYVKDYVKADELGLWPDAKVRTQARSPVSSKIGDMVFTSWTIGKPYGDKNQYSKTVASWQIALKVGYKQISRWDYASRKVFVAGVMIKFDVEGTAGEKTFLLPFECTPEELVDNKEKIVASLVQVAQTAIQAQQAAQNVLTSFIAKKE
jgi:hypothetical protein